MSERDAPMQLRTLLDDAEAAVQRARAAVQAAQLRARWLSAAMPAEERLPILEHVAATSAALVDVSAALAGVTRLLVPAEPGSTS